MFSFSQVKGGEEKVQSTSGHPPGSGCLLHSHDFLLLGGNGKEDKMGQGI